MAKAKKVASGTRKTVRKGSSRGAKQTRADGSNAPASSTGRKTPAVMDRRSGRDRRSGSDRRKRAQPVKVERRKIERRAKVNRRRQIDPTTCERDYSPDEIEFMNALDEYKRTSGRMFPTCSEILEVIKKLGYRKPSAEESPEAPAPVSQTRSSPPDPVI